VQDGQASLCRVRRSPLWGTFAGVTRRMAIGLGTPPKRSARPQEVPHALLFELTYSLGEVIPQRWTGAMKSWVLCCMGAGGVRRKLTNKGPAWRQAQGQSNERFTGGSRGSS
jgi:hypothetical protein